MACSIKTCVYVSTEMIQLEKLRARLHGSTTTKLEEKLMGCLQNTQVQVEEIRCQHCGNTNLVVDYERGEVVCPRCGTVVVDHLPDITRPEYRLFSSEDILEREHYHRVNPALESDFGTRFDELPRELGIRKSVVMSVHLDSRVRLEAYAQSLVKAIAPSLGLAEHEIEQVLRLYKAFTKRARTKIPPVRVLVGALIHLVKGTSIGKIAEVLGVEPRSIKGALSRLRREMPEVTQIITRKHIGMYRFEQIRKAILDIYEKLAEQCDVLRRLEVRQAILGFALDLARKIVEHRLLQGRIERGIAATCLYIAMSLFARDLPVAKQKVIAQAAGICDITIRSIYREIVNKLNIVIQV